jgi:hypothetical protein
MIIYFFHFFLCPGNREVFLIYLNGLFKILQRFIVPIKIAERHSFAIVKFWVLRIELDFILVIAIVIVLSLHDFNNFSFFLPQPSSQRNRLALPWWLRRKILALLRSDWDCRALLLCHSKLLGPLDRAKFFGKSFLNLSLMKIKYFFQSSAQPRTKRLSSLYLDGIFVCFKRFFLPIEIPKSYPLADVSDWIFRIQLFSFFGEL